MFIFKLLPYSPAGFDLTTQVEKIPLDHATCMFTFGYMCTSLSHHRNSHRVLILSKLKLCNMYLNHIQIAPYIVIFLIYLYFSIVFVDCVACEG
jgi:hypothetical protein